MGHHLKDIVKANVGSTDSSDSNIDLPDVHQQSMQLNKTSRMEFPDESTDKGD